MIKDVVWNSMKFCGVVPTISTKTYDSTSVEFEVYIYIYLQIDCLKSFHFFNSYPTDTEYLLRSVKPLLHEKKKKTDKPFDPTCRSYDLPKPKLLPPLPTKPQVGNL